MSDPKPRALVAEDTELGRWAIAHALAKEGFEVDIVDNMAAAVGQILGGIFAVLVAAVPAGDVCELVGAVKRNQPTAGLILLAGHNQVEAVAAACGESAIVIEKPFNVDRVVEMACTFAARARRGGVTARKYAGTW